jgi:hypothetical protein
MLIKIGEGLRTTRGRLLIGTGDGFKAIESLPAFWPLVRDAF